MAQELVQAEETKTDASQRLMAVMLNAVPERSPALQVSAAANEAERLAAESETRGLEWMAEYQREGWSSGFDDQPNAAQYLRLGTSFLPFWNLKDARVMRRSAGELQRARDMFARQETAQELAELWLMLAAQVELGDLLGTRLERLNQAVEIEEKRLEFGEVAENQVIQLRLERLLCRSEVQQNQTQQAELRQQLLAKNVDASLLPRRGDLEGLYSSAMDPLPSEDQLDELVSQRHRDVKLARFAAAHQQAASRLTRATAFGFPEAQVEWEQIPELDGAPSFDGFGVTLSVPLPLSKAGKQRAAASRIRARQAELEVDWVQKRVLANCRSEWRRAAETRDWLQQSRAEWETVEETQQSLAKQIQLGAVTFVEYIDALSRLDQVREQIVKFQMEGLMSRLRLAMVLGDGALFPLPEEMWKEQS